MSLNFVTPGTEDVSALLEIIFGAELEVNEGSCGDLSTMHLATFIDDEDKLVALCASDLPFVVYSGAALSMIPAAAANEMVAENDVSKAIQDNFYEVMNICSKLMMSDRSDHLRLDKAMAPEETADHLGQLDAAKKVSFDINIPDYGKGAMTFLIA